MTVCRKFSLILVCVRTNIECAMIITDSQTIEIIVHLILSVQMNRWMDGWMDAMIEASWILLFVYRKVLLFLHEIRR